MKRALVSIIALSLAVMGASAQSKLGDAKDIPHPKSIVICSSNVGNLWYNNAVKISEILMAAFPDMSVTVIEGGGDSNIDAVNIGADVQLGITSSTSLLPALAGTNAQVKNASNVYALMTLGQSIAQTAVPAKSKIRDYPDLVGKKIAAGDYKQVAMYTFLALLDAYGIDSKKVKIQAVASSEYPDMIADHLLDGCHINGNLPLATLVQIDSTTPIRLLQPNKNALKKLLEKYPSFYTVKVKAGQYKGQTEDLELLAYDGILIANKKLPGPFLAKLVELVTTNATLDPKQFNRTKWNAYPTFINKSNTAPEVWSLIQSYQ
jgi:TRAP transporter TAXI family solute receptor